MDLVVKIGWEFSTFWEFSAVESFPVAGVFHDWEFNAIGSFALLGVFRGSDLLTP
jgi:hypothetical protein